MHYNWLCHVSCTCTFGRLDLIVLSFHLFCFLFYQVYRANEAELRGLGHNLVNEFHNASKNFVDKVNSGVWPYIQCPLATELKVLCKNSVIAYM